MTITTKRNLEHWLERIESYTFKLEETKKELTEIAKEGVSYSGNRLVSRIKALTRSLEYSYRQLERVIIK